jgi:hypothetical protein
MEVFDLYMAFNDWQPETKFILLEYSKEIWQGNWPNFPGCFYKKKVDEFGILPNGVIWIEIELE